MTGAEVDLLIATRSEHKLREIRRILAGEEEGAADARHAPDTPHDALPTSPGARGGGVRVLGLDDAGIAPEAAEDALEPYETFEENARSKARYFHDRSGLATVADDSGLAVDALGGRPGVRSKRFAPVDLDGEARDRANNAHLLELLRDEPAEARTARYVCVAVLIEEDGTEHVFRGTAEGRILDEERGEGGFGYDPLFFDPELDRTFAEIPQGEKNARSHRGEAFRALRDHLTGADARGTAGASDTRGTHSADPESGPDAAR